MGKLGPKQESVEHKAALCEGVKYGPSVRNRKGGVLVQTHMCRLIHRSTVTSIGPQG